MPTRTPSTKTAPGQLALQFELPLSFPDDSTHGPTAEKTRRIALNLRTLDYRFRRSRRRSIGFMVDDLGLTVTAPRWVTLAQVDDAIREKESWIFAKIAEIRARRQAIPRVRWEHGGTLPYLGANLTLRTATSSMHAQGVRFDPDTRELHMALPASASSQQIKDMAQGWLQSQAQTIFAARLDFYADRLGVRHSAFRLSSAAARWGSCTADGRILLNWRLVHFPLSSIDYVVAHELAHLKEMNHGPNFWRTVGAILPGFEVARAQLKDPPTELVPLL